MLGAANARAELEAQRVAKHIVPEAIKPAEHGHATGERPIDIVTTAEINALAGAGDRLPCGVRRGFEATLQRPLGGVRIHTGVHADALASRLGASAFTLGDDIFFRRAAYDPAAPAGRRLLTHELTHVGQQGRADVVRRAPAPGQAALLDPTELPPASELVTMSDAAIYNHARYIDQGIENVTFRVGESFTVHYSNGSQLTLPLDDPEMFVFEAAQRPNSVSFGGPPPVPPPAAVDYSLEQGRIVPTPIDHATAPVLYRTLRDAYKQVDERTAAMAADGKQTMESMAWMVPAPALRIAAPELLLGARTISLVRQMRPRYITSGPSQSTLGHLNPLATSASGNSASRSTLGALDTTLSQGIQPSAGPAPGSLGSPGKSAVAGSKVSSQLSPGPATEALISATDASAVGAVAARKIELKATGVHPLFKEAEERLLRAEGTGAQKAEFYSTLLKEQVYPKTGHSFMFKLEISPKGHFVFSGETGRLRVIDKDGNIYKGILETGINFVTNEPNFGALEKLN